MNLVVPWRFSVFLLSSPTRLCPRISRPRMIPMAAQWLFVVSGSRVCTCLTFHLKSMYHIRIQSYEGEAGGVVGYLDSPTELGSVLRRPPSNSGCQSRRASSLPTVEVGGYRLTRCLKISDARIVAAPSTQGRKTQPTTPCHASASHELPLLCQDRTTHRRDNASHSMNQARRLRAQCRGFYSNHVVRCFRVD